MKSLTDRFIDIVYHGELTPDKARKVARMVFDAPDTPESMGLRAFLYHDGIGVEQDLEKCYELVDRAITEGRDPLAYYLLGYLCEHAETPDQACGGPRQEYDHYDAERFYEQCAAIESPWRRDAAMWLGDYYMDMARGGDPEVAADYYRIAGVEED